MTTAVWRHRSPVTTRFDKFLFRQQVPLLAILLYCQSAGSAQQPALVPLAINNQVSADSSRNFLTDPRVFNAEFYRKFYPGLHLASDADATRNWTNSGARACRRGSFYFNAHDYLMPISAEVGVRQGRREANRLEIAFKDYRRYGSAVKILDFKPIDKP